jgi:hypothetical protein
MASEEISQATPAQPATASAAAPATEVIAAAPEKLDELEEINFLLEEIESKIAPLALA